MQSLDGPVTGPEAPLVGHHERPAGVFGSPDDGSPVFQIGCQRLGHEHVAAGCETGLNMGTVQVIGGDDADRIQVLGGQHPLDGGVARRHLVGLLRRSATVVVGIADDEVADQIGVRAGREEVSAEAQADDAHF